MKKFKRVLAALLVMIMVLQPAAFAASVADFLDFPFGWSKDAMTAAVENGLYIGNESKLIEPDKALTRGTRRLYHTCLRRNQNGRSFKDHRCEGRRLVL